MALLLCSFIFFLLFSSCATACDSCVYQSKATFFANPKGLSTGACRYGSFALGLAGGRLAAAATSIFKNGAGCGACFQIRCKDATLCTKTGTPMIVTDFNVNNETSFVLSSRAFSAMAQDSKSQDILNRGIVDVEFKRIPCYYKNQNLALRVEESSKRPHYLAVKIIYQGGQTEILSIDVAQVGSSNWSSMNRNSGALWDTSKVPAGALQFRFTVTSGYDRKQISAQNVLPADWNSGVVYDTKVQINDIAQENCPTCDDGTWKK